jgi:hypothetical protein
MNSTSSRLVMVGAVAGEMVVMAFAMMVPSDGH